MQEFEYGMDAQADAVTLALYLGIIAPDTESAAEMNEMAAGIAKDMTEEEVEACRTRAQLLAELPHEVP